MSDLIDGIVQLSRSDEHFPTNIGNPTELTILKFAQIVLEVAGSSSSIRFEPLPEDDPTRGRPDISNANRVLSWEPKVGLREGLRLSLEYFRQCLGQQAVDVEYLSRRSSQSAAAEPSRQLRPHPPPTRTAWNPGKRRLNPAKH